jgi:choline monooxygenase
VNFDTSAAWYGERVAACNWKTAIDNVIECYHCPTVHPEFSAAFDTRAQALEVTVIGQGCSSMAAPQRGKADGDQAGGDYHAYFAPPNFYLSARGTAWFFASSYDPIDATHSLWRTEFYVPEGTSEASIQEILAASETVFNEDIAVSEKVQLAHDLKTVPSGYLLPHSEEPLRTFASFVYEAVANGRTN